MQLVFIIVCLDFVGIHLFLFFVLIQFFIRFTFFVCLGYFNIYTREAGAGSLSIAMEGPSKAEINFQDKKDGSCEVAYTCTEPGKSSMNSLSLPQAKW